MAKKKTDQTDQELFKEAEKHWHAFLNCLIRAQNNHNMTFQLCLGELDPIDNCDLTLPDEEYDYKKLDEDGCIVGDTPCASFMLERTFSS